MFKHTLIGLAMAAVNNAAVAESPKKIDDEILVTATKTEQPVFKSLASVSVLTEDDIRRIQAPSVLQLLDTLPGIDTKSSGGRGTNSSIYMRGTESDHVLVLVDGVRTAAVTNGTTALQSIPVEAIEKIEVVRGPRSSLYGAEAIGGVIQIFTKKGTEGFQGSISTEYGSHDLSKTAVSARGQLGGTRYSVNGVYEETNGIDRTIKSGTTNDDRDGYHEAAWSVSVDHEFDSGVMVGMAMNRNDSDVDFDNGGDDFTETVIENRNGYIALPITEDLKLKLAGSRFRDTRETFGTRESVFETIRNTREAQLDYQLTQDQQITFGYEYFNDEVASTQTFDAEERDNEALFVQYQGSFGRYSGSASVRKDDNEAFGNKYTRSFSVGYEIQENLMASLSYGTAFKAPTFNDLYYPLERYPAWPPFAPYEYSGNPDLKPEESESIEFMIRGVNDASSWHFSLYKTKIDNLIELVTLVDTPALRKQTVDNIAKAEILGGELGAEFSVLGINVNSSVSYVDPRNEETDAMLPNRARGKVNVDLSRTLGKLELILAWQAQSHRFTATGDRLGGYNTVDLRANYQVTPKLLVSAKVENLFDKHYRYDPKFETDGQTASISARYSF